jgi:KTSC domain
MCPNRLGDVVVHWELLDSSVFTAAAYLPARRMLYLRFRSGELYRYVDFPPDLYHDFLAADSKGQYFARHIRDRFPCQHLPRSRSASGSST